MSAKLQQQPVYLLLLPVFFVLHGYVENLQYIHPADLVMPVFTYLSITIGIAFLCWLLFRDIHKSAMAAFVLMNFYFFFGALHTFLRVHEGTRRISSYTFLLLAFVTLFAVLLFYMKKNCRSYRELTVFLNVLFLIYIVVDTISLISNATTAQRNKLVVSSFIQKNPACDTCTRPDIYFLLMDEYASSTALKQLYHYDNSLDSFLLNNHFSIQKHSYSNYNYTPFSIASLLNMSYINGIKNKNAVDMDDFLACQLVIRNNEVIKTLSAKGYDIVNYSIFDLAGHPTIVPQSFLPSNTDLITRRTLFWNIRKDIGWRLVKWYPFKWIWKSDLMLNTISNEKLITLVKQSIREKPRSPRFIYAHFLMPHYPYYYNNKGRLKDISTIMDEMDHPAPKDYVEYLNYLPYVNSRIEDMITAIRHKEPSAVIILMGDHGFRGQVPHDYHFKNLNAVYFPDTDYRTLYDSISCVNQFRVIFNKLFKESLPLAKDTPVYLTKRQAYR